MTPLFIVHQIEAWSFESELVRVVGVFSSMELAEHGAQADLDGALARGRVPSYCDDYYYEIFECNVNEQGTTKTSFRLSADLCHARKLENALDGAMYDEPEDNIDSISLDAYASLIGGQKAMWRYSRAQRYH
jgi:hypothetical protein